MLHIFDISAYQSSTAPHADAVIAKATEGKNYTSTKFRAQYASAKDNARHRGAYHFARPEESSYRDQANRFLQTVQPTRGESVWLDLEASKLSQAQTNAWARGWGDYIRDQAPDVASGIYLGWAYVSNGTGRDLSKHFRFWWYPQYPAAFQLTVGTDIEELRAANRSSRVPGRFPIAAKTTRWASSFTPSLPSTNTTGWVHPDLWQFTDNLGGSDASISPLTLDQLAGGGQPTPQEEPEMIARELLPGLDKRTEFPLEPGKFTTFVAFGDNSYTSTNVQATGPISLRVVVLHDDGTWQKQMVTVGRAATDKSTKVASFKISNPAHAVAISVTRDSGDGTEQFTVGAY